MKRIAAVWLIGCAGCGSEPFGGELFGVREDGGQLLGEDAGSLLQESSVDVQVREDAPGCTDGYLRLPGDDGSYAVLPGDLDAVVPFSVEALFRLEEGDGELRVERDGPENPCGWSFTVRGDTVKATVPAVFDHYAPLPVVGRGWLRIGWRYDGQQSVVLVDGAPHSASPKPMPAPVPTCSGPARVEGEGRVDAVHILGSRWDFEEKSGPGLVPSGELIGQVTRECR